MYLTNIFGIKGDNYQTHKLIMELFDGEERPLFQINGGSAVVLTKGPPKKAGSYIETQKAEISFKTGETMLFSLRVNPVKAAAQKNKRGKRVPLSGKDASAWLDRKAAAGGFKFVSRRISDEGTNVSEKNGEKIFLKSLYAIGILEVTDAALFQTSVTNGIGPGKGLGFGLLNIFS